MPTEILTAREIALNEKHAEAHIFAGDGRPFRTASVTHPPAPGGTWPAQRDDDPIKPKGLVVELTRENLDTPEKRRVALTSIIESGFIGSELWSHSAQTIIENAWLEIQGHAIPEVKKSVAANRVKIAEFNKAYTDAATAFAASEALKKLHVRRNETSAALVDRRRVLAQAEAVIASPVNEVEVHADSINSLETVLRAGSRLAGAREVVPILRKKVIPSLEKQLADLDAEISAHS